MTETPFHAENAFTAPLIAKLKRHPKRIVFPESEDVRILRVAQELAERRISAPILLGNRERLRKMAASEGISLSMVGIVDPETTNELPMFCDRFERMERFRKMNVAHPEQVMKKPHYFAAMMVQYGHADAIVGGNQVYPSLFFRSLFHMIRLQPHCSSASSCMVVVDENNLAFGNDGILFLADCAIIPEPTLDELAMIAVETGRLAGSLLGRAPNVAMLSYSTKGSAQTQSATEMVAATELARQRARKEMVDMEIDGELQLDVALLPDAAERKNVKSLVAGKADVLIFPDLNASNIGSKLLIIGANPQVYGHLILGLAKPAAQVSRIATTETIFGVAVAVGVEAIKYREMVFDDEWVMGQ